MKLILIVVTGIFAYQEERYKKEEFILSGGHEDVFDYVNLGSHLMKVNFIHHRGDSVDEIKRVDYRKYFPED